MGSMAEILHLLTDPAAWLALATLIVMEVVLGIDNLVFVALLTNKLPESMRARARRIGISLALILRLLLLATLAFIVGLTQPVITVLGHAFSWRDLILLGGGGFLMWKATRELGSGFGVPSGSQGARRLTRTPTSARMVPMTV